MNLLNFVWMLACGSATSPPPPPITQVCLRQVVWFWPIGIKGEEFEALTIWKLSNTGLDFVLGKSLCGCESVACFNTKHGNLNATEIHVGCTWTMSNSLLFRNAWLQTTTQELHTHLSLWRSSSSSSWGEREREREMSTVARSAPLFFKQF